MMIYHMTLLLTVAWALLIFNEKQVYCVVLSLPSEYETFCNGMHCPPRSSCVASVNVINGNKTSDTSCSNINGDIVRQEIITVSNGERCIKNLTMMGKKVNVEQSCRNLSKAEAEQLKNNQKIEAAAQEWERDIEKKTEDIERALEMLEDKLERADETREEHLEEGLAEMEKNLEAKLG